MAVVALPIDVYDFETVIEAAVKTVLSAAGVANVYTGADAVIERVLPRVEVQFQLGGEMPIQELVGNDIVTCGWRGTITMQPVAESGDMVTLRELRAQCRDTAARWKARLDAELPTYSLIDCVGNGAQPTFATDKGYWACSMAYTISFALLPQTLNELNQAQQNAV